MKVVSIGVSELCYCTNIVTKLTDRDIVRVHRVEIKSLVYVLAFAGC